MFPDHAIKAAEREFSCRCNEGYTVRGLIDPDCRCDDMRHALEAAWGALHPPTCCRHCREVCDAQARQDGAPFSLIIARPMFVCPSCGDKRCAKAADHREPCPDL